MEQDQKLTIITNEVISTWHFECHLIWYDLNSSMFFSFAERHRLARPQVRVVSFRVLQPRTISRKKSKQAERILYHGQSMGQGVCRQGVFFSVFWTGQIVGKGATNESSIFRGVCFLQRPGDAIPRFLRERECHPFS